MGFELKHSQKIFNALTVEPTAANQSRNGYTLDSQDVHQLQSNCINFLTIVLKKLCWRHICSLDDAPISFLTHASKTSCRVSQCYFRSSSEEVLFPKIIYPLVIQHSYRTSPFLLGKPAISMDHFP